MKHVSSLHLFEATYESAVLIHHLSLSMCGFLSIFYVFKNDLYNVQLIFQWILSIFFSNAKG